MIVHNTASQLGTGSGADSEVRRPLRPTEKWFWIADQVSPVTGVARVRLRGHLAAGLLERAAAALTAEYPMLRVSITSDSRGRCPAFVASTRPTPIRRVHGDDREWERQVEEHEMGTPLDWRRGPLIRIVDVELDSPDEAHDLLLAVSHIIADGLTALSLLHKLVEHAHRLTVSQGEDVVESRPVVDAPDDLLPARHRGVRGVVTIAATQVADRLTAVATRRRRLEPETIVPASQRKTRLLRRTLTSTQLDALSQRCRAEDVTVHCALTAAMAMVIGPTVAQKDSGRICIGSPINIRRELEPPVAADEVGAYVTMSQAILSFGGDGDLWSVARQVTRSARRRSRRRQDLALVYAMRFLCPASVGKSPKVFRLIDRHGPGNVCISNMGRYDFPAGIGEWRLSGAQLAANLSISGYFVAIINTSHGELFWNFFYTDRAVTKRTAQRFADGCVQTLLDAID
jgi:NRPS condensation-like uncharacterized protein